ncbi:molybdopterin-guanine dinucleotide biosynthesis protein B [Virgibacillus byunsanensis]|uniref:Molybdopterin-guanine dinucleotide biosynthesis protein B n=1 Tax=Virgibacillus byunsanensis TaxID=570945 RepID=A0ABW3LH69_9BACI
MANFPIVQVVGYKNSGKTTLMNQLINYFSSKGKQVGSLKHHGHGGEPKMVKGTDSYGHLQSGATMSGVQGEKQLQLTLHTTTQIALDDIINMYTAFPLDLLLVEGYKQADYPKIVLLTGEEDLHLLDELSNIIAIGAMDEDLLHAQELFSVHLEQSGSYLPMLVEHIWAKSQRLG